MESAAQDRRVVIVGGGSAGITVAARLRRAQPSLSVLVIDPAQQHYYQPLWTLVGAGEATLAGTAKPMRDVLPRDVEWLPDAVTGFQPEANRVTTREHGEVAYDALVVCPGIQIDWQAIPGLEETLGTNEVYSNYSAEHVEQTWAGLQRFRGGTAIFTFPATPIKCAGAPQKIMYLAEHHFRRAGRRDATRIIFASAAAGIFGVKKYADALDRIIADRGIEPRFRFNLESVDGPRKTATFRHLDTGAVETLAFDFLHVAPPMSAPDVIKTSPLANAQGWVDVNRNTTQHARYANVFSLGDASSLPTSKTGAAIRKQAPVLVDHLTNFLRGSRGSMSYDGYTSCPLVTGYGKLILAEFDYDGNPAETFPFDQSQERRSMYWLKKHGLPRLYWHGMLKGRA